jgi:hypothetical protein
MTDALRPKRPRLAEAVAVAAGIKVGAAREWLALGERWGWTLAASSTDTWDTVERPGGVRRRAEGLAWRDGGRSGDAGFLPLDGQSSVGEAWETLCQRLDLPAWVDDPRRRFACGCDGGRMAPVFDLGDDLVAGVMRVRRRLELHMERSLTGGGWAASIHPADLAALTERAGFATTARRTPDVYDYEFAGVRLIPTTDRARGTLRVLNTDEVVCDRCDGVAARSHPATVADCVVFAADAAGVLAAEAIARETLTAVPRVVWRVTPADEHARARRDVARWPRNSANDWHRALTAATGYVCAGVEGDAVVLVAPAL